MNKTAPLLEARGVKKYFTASEGMLGACKVVRAVDGVSFSILPGDTFGLVGESGCGKTTLGRVLLALEQATEGKVFFQGQDVFALPPASLRRLRREIQVIFQDPFSSLDPRMTVRRILEEPFLIHDECSDRAERATRIARLMDAVGLAASHLDRYPHEFSGGQRQRIGIARALALHPKLIVADEPVSALDVSIQAQILNLLKDLQREFNLTYLFVSHDFSVVRHLCAKVAVMYLGKIVEMADTETLFSNPQHPYTEALLSAVPIPDPTLESERKRVLLLGDVPDPMNPPSGCSFHTRCRYVRASCRTDVPALLEVGPGHRSACPVRPFKDKPSTAALPAGQAEKEVQ